MVVGPTCPAWLRMVSYQTWTSIAFEVAQSRGMVSNQENNRDLISVVAEVWRDRKPELSTATRSQAENIAKEEIHVQGSL